MVQGVDEHYFDIGAVCSVGVRAFLLNGILLRAAENEVVRVCMTWIVPTVSSGVVVGIGAFEGAAEAVNAHTGVVRMLGQDFLTGALCLDFYTVPQGGRVDGAA